MRFLLVLAVAGLAVSAYFAPRHYESRPAVAPTDGLVETDPRARLRQGEEIPCLGTILSGYQELYVESPEDPEALRGVFRICLALGGAAFGEQELDILLADIVQHYLARRAEIDPYGALLRETVRDLIRVRRHHPFWIARASVSIFRTAVGDDGGLDDLLAFTNQGPFHLEFFGFADRFLPAWPAVEPMVRYYLEHGDLVGRVQAGVTLLYYHEFYGLGGEILGRLRPEIRSAFLEAKAALSPTADDAVALAAGLVGLAMLGDPDLLEVLRGMRILDYPYVVDTIRMARLTAGIDSLSLYEPGSQRWEFLGVARELAFRAAAFRFARLTREDREPEEKQRAREILEFGRYERDNPLTQIYCFRLLAAAEPGTSSGMVEEMLEAGGAARLYAAFHASPDRRLGIVLPYLAVNEPGLSAIAAAALLDIEHNVPIQMPTR